MSSSSASPPDPLAVEVVEHGPAVLHADDGRVVGSDTAAPSRTGDPGVARAADPVLTGVELRDALDDVRHVFVHRPDQLVPVRLTPDEARVFLRRASGFPQPVVVTARVRGPDMVVHTLHYLGHPTRRLRLGGAGPPSPSSSPAGSADAAADAVLDAAAPDLLRGLGRPRRVARGRVTRKRPSHGLLIVPVAVRSVGRSVPASEPEPSDDERLPPGVTAVDDRDSY